MMSAKKFRSKSNIFMHRRKNPIIKDIDTLMKEYEKSTSENRKMKCLVYIYMMCKQYFHQKPDGRRGDAVQELMDQVKDILNSNDFKRQIAEKAGGRHYSGGVKRDLMQTTGSSATGMASGYTFEGILPQKNFVEKMKLNMDSILGSDKKYFGSSLISGKFEEHFQVNEGMGLDESTAAAHRAMASGPFSDVLDMLHTMWTRADSGDGDFNYLNSSQRLDYLVSFRNGQLFFHKTGAAVDTGQNWGETGRVLYAIDTSERLYVLTEGGASTKYNHSSLLSGAPVICAGMIAVNQGRVEYISNESGHYKPGIDNLQDAVRILEHNGVNIRRFKVSDMKTGEYPSGAAFQMASRGGGFVLGRRMAH